MIINKETRGLEWLFGGMMVAWGSVIMFFPQMFNHKIYESLLTLAPTYIWGAIAVSLGIGRIIALLINGLWKRNPLIRFAGALYGMMWWSLLGTCYVIAIIKHDAVPSPMLACFPLFVIFEGVSVYRCGKDMCYMGSLRRSSSHARI